MLQSCQMLHKLFLKLLQRFQTLKRNNTKIVSKCTTNVSKVKKNMYKFLSKVLQSCQGLIKHSKTVAKCITKC